MRSRRFALVVGQFPLPLPTPPGEDYFAESARIMAEAGFEVEILTVRRAGQTDCEMLNGVRLRRFASPPRLVRAIASGGFDVLHTHSHFRPALLTGLVSPRARSIFTSHSYALPGSWWKRCVLVTLMNRFDRVIALTPFERDVYRAAGVHESKIVVLPLPVNVAFFATGDGARFRSRWNIHDKEPLVLFVANLRPVKNPDVATRAIQHVRQVIPNARLVILGANLMATDAVRAEGVVFADWQPAEVLCDALAAADVVVNSSSHESFSLSTCEAMAARRPVCLPDLPSLRSLIGDNALYHPPSDADGLATNILRYLREPELRRAHVEANCRLVERFDTKIVLEQYSALCQSLLKS